MNIKKDILLKSFSTFRIGGPARYFVEIEEEGDLREAVRFANENHLQLFILGGGSNILISDDGFDGLVIKISDSRFICNGTSIEVGAGLSLPELVKRTASQGLKGLEWAGGLPGSVGGALFGNAGCFGHEIQEVVDNIIALKMFSPRLRLETYTKRECEFSYRGSRFKNREGYIIFRAMLKLSAGETLTLQKDVQEKIDYRETRHPLEYPNIGSIFKNIGDQDTVRHLLVKLPRIVRDVKQKWHGKVPAAVLIEQAGLRGKQIGGAQISEKHANFIINKGNASARDVLLLIKEIKTQVKEKFNLELEQEVRYVGFK